MNGKKRHRSYVMRKQRNECRLHEMFNTERVDEDVFCAGRDLMLTLLRKYARNSLSYLDIERDKRFFFSRSVEGGAAYSISGHDMVICGDPICAKTDLPAFLLELKKYEHRHRLRVIFLFVLEENVKVYREMGFGIYKGGEEALFDLNTYSMHGGKAAKVRASFHQAKRDGLTVYEYCPNIKHETGIENDMNAITDAWLSRKHTSMLKFALGTNGFDYPCDKRYFYASDQNGVMQGFMVFNPFLGKKGYIADVMRRRPGCTHGVMELIFHDAYEKMKEEGVKYGSLGIAPLYAVTTGKGSGDSMFEKLEHFNYEKMNEIYGFRSLYEAKMKFAPTSWEPVFIACSPRHMTLSMGYSMVNVLDTKGFGDYCASFSAYYLHRRSKAQADGLRYFVRSHHKKHNNNE